MRKMNHLSLFTGAGGGELGAILNGWHTVGYVEWDDYCQRVLAQRIKDGILPEAPIFGNVRAFISEGYAEAYQGMVDVISGGFPCQPFSQAGKQVGQDDPRNMWPGTIECICLVRPQYVLLENVPALLNFDYIGQIFGDLAEAGFDARWCVLGADNCGANHRRKRLWILAYPTGGAIHNNILWQGNKLGNGKEDIWWGSGMPVSRMVDGVAHRVDRLKAIGNGQVPAVVRAVWRLLAQSDHKSRSTGGEP